MKYLPYLLLFCATLVIADPGDDKFLAAREAYRVGDAARLARMSDALRANNPAHDLAPWTEYWQLRLQTAAYARLPAADSATGPGRDIDAFIERNAGSYLAERLRADWLKTLGRRGDWSEFLGHFAKLENADQETACYSWQAKMALDSAASVPDGARELWFVATELPASCLPLIDRLVNAGRLSESDIRARVRMTLDTGKYAEAETAARYLLAHGQMPDTKALERIAAAPLKYLSKLPADLERNRRSRETALFAVLRYARKDAADAARRWSDIEEHFDAEDRGYAWGQLARQAARSHMSEALAWYDKAGAVPLSEDEQAWRVRAALRELDWPAVLAAIARMPESLASRPDWIYWRARALSALGSTQEATSLYQTICAQPGFYGLLAAEELGLPLSLPPRAAPVTSDELAKAAANPGLRQALALFRLDMRTEGVRIWNWSVRNMDDRSLLAAAELARSNHIFDRTISTAERTLAEHDYSLRYLAPYRDSVSPKTLALALDDSWVYGLMRQESRFVTSAKSGVGASGLMQVMPSTAKLVARRIGLKGYKPAHNDDMETNVTLGTNYLKMVLDSLDNHPVLACTAYNAGPGRAQRWRGDRAIEGAIYAETIPFSETRDYVKKVMANSIYYSALFEEKPLTLKSRLGIVQPRLPADTIREDDAGAEP